MAGLVDFSDENAVKEYMENIQIEFMYGCHRERKEDSCFRLGEFLETFKKKFVESAKIYKDCCETWKSAPCCYKLGNFHMLGRGLVEKSKLKAYDCYRIACAQSNYEDHGKNDRIAAACCCKANLLSGDQTVREKFLDEVSRSDQASDNSLLYKEIIDSYSRACALRDAGGCNSLSLMYMNEFQGLPESKNFKLAAKFAEKACDLGKAMACHNLHIMYKRGDGVDKNLVKAKEFASRRDEIRRGGEALTFGG